MATSRLISTGKMEDAAELPPSQSSGHYDRCSSTRKPVIVGLYGIPGSGKTYMMRELKQRLGKGLFTFYEGSESIAQHVSGGLSAFQSLQEDEKLRYRQVAIDTIAKDCHHSGNVGVVTGHFMFWPEGAEAGTSVYTSKDLDTYTHIIYLEVPADTVAHRRLAEAERKRPATSATHLHEWQEAEKSQLRQLCCAHGILFSLLPSSSQVLERATTLLEDFRVHSEESNLARAKANLEMSLIGATGRPETVLMLDGDKTLAAEDTGELFWKIASESEGLYVVADTLRQLFGSPMGYSHAAFRQATLYYEELPEREFERLCQDVASAVTLRPEFKTLLHLVARAPHVRAIVVTCGLRRVWEMVLDREHLSNKIGVVGGGRISDGFVVSAGVKKDLTCYLRDHHNAYVWAIGDSVLDLDMMKHADQAIVVVGDKQSRSKSMESALAKAIREGLRARQVLLSGTTAHRLDLERLPQVQITAPEFVDSILCHRSRRPRCRILDATEKNAAKLLMTPTRDASISGPSLRHAHSEIGKYLCVEFLSEILGLEKYSIPHVQGHYTEGHRLLHEEQTSIVALMRGGEPMAYGVSEMLPRATFLHAREPVDVKCEHLKGKRNVILVDSVVNSGDSMVQFAEHIRGMHSTICIVVLAGVVQAGALSGGSFAHALERYSDFSLVALRISENKFTGKGTTDTGNRLFNTTFLQ